MYKDKSPQKIIGAVTFSADRFKPVKALKLRTKRTTRRIFSALLLRKSQTFGLSAPSCAVRIRCRARVCKQTFVSSVLHLKSSSPMRFLMRQPRQKLTLLYYIYVIVSCSRRNPGASACKTYAYDKSTLLFPKYIYTEGFRNI